MKTRVSEVVVKGVVVKSNLPKAGYVVNPYTGCQFGCVYCYSDFMRRWTGHTNEKWGEFVDVKINAAEIVQNQDHGGKDILFSSVTDPYQPLEARHSLTRRLLEILVEQRPQPTVGILTKSNLVTRDIDVLKRFRKCTVGFSICTLDDRVRRVLEPVAPAINKRIDAVKAVREAGIRTYVFISPIMPYLTDVRAILEALKPHASFFMFESLNIRPNLRTRISDALKKIDPDLVPKYEEIYSDKAKRKQFWTPVEKEVLLWCVEAGIKPGEFFHH